MRRPAACCVALHALCVSGYQPAVIRGGTVVAPRAAPVHLNFLKGDGAVAADSSVRAREKAMIDWLGDNGVALSPNAGWGTPPHPLRVESDTVEDFELSGRGLLARKEITQGEEIVRIPTKVLMTKAAAVRVLGPRVVGPELGEYLALALLLMHERALGGASFWAPYINLLPDVEEVGQTWTWSEEELEMLTGSGVLVQTASLKAKLRREFDTLTAQVIQPNGLDASAFTYESFQWAMCMLFSRAIDLRETGELALVPYADLLNHSPYANSYFFYNSVPLSSEREVCLYADRLYAKNDQVLISYGQKSNGELILLYGFVVDRNLFDEVEITVSLDESDPRYDEKVTFLRGQGLQPSMAFPLLIDRYSSELTQFLRLCCVTPQMGPLGDYKYAERISSSNERAAMQVLRTGCLEALAQYPDSEEDDRKLMENGKMFATLPRNARMAVKLRRNEKRILHRTIKVCEVALDAMQEQITGKAKSAPAPPVAGSIAEEANSKLW
jgi:hypothetical protein